MEMLRYGIQHRKFVTTQETLEQVLLLSQSPTLWNCYGITSTMIGLENNNNAQVKKIADSTDNAYYWDLSYWRYTTKLLAQFQILNCKYKVDKAII